MGDMFPIYGLLSGHDSLHSIKSERLWNGNFMGTFRNYFIIIPTLASKVSKNEPLMMNGASS